MEERLIQEMLSQGDTQNNDVLSQSGPTEILVDSTTLEPPWGSNVRTKWHILEPEVRLQTIEAEARTFLDENGLLTSTRLRREGRRDLLGAVRRYFPGGLAGLQTNLGLEVRKQKPKGYWNNEKIEAEASEFYQQNGMLTQRKLTQMDRQDLQAQISINYPGGFRSLKTKLGIKPGRRENGYFDRERIETELRRIIEEHGDFPSLKMLRNIDSTLAAAVSIKGGVNFWREKFAFSVNERPKNYWKDPANIRSEITQIIDDLGHFPTATEIRALGLDSLVAAIIKTGGFRNWQEEFGYKKTKTKNGFWTDERLGEELSLVIEMLGHFPTENELKDLRKTQLASALSENGGYLEWRMTMGFEPIVKEPGYWRDPENILNEALKVVEQGIPLTNEELRRRGYSSLAGAISSYHVGGLRALREEMGLTAVRHSPKHWNVETIEREAIEFVGVYGFLSVPLLRQHSRTDLLHAILKRYPGNLTGLKEKLGIDQSGQPSITPDQANEQLARLMEVAK